MTDDKRSQEAEDVAREITRLLLKLNWINPYRGSGRPKRALKTPELFDAVVADLLTADVFNPDGILPILARLVREGQIKVLREALEHEWVTREGGLDRHSVSSSRLRARIAALRQEG